MENEGMMTKGRLGIAGIASVLIALGFWEGTKYTVYNDIGGVPTVCTGATDPDDIVLGKVYTKEECAYIDAKNVQLHDAGISKCIGVEVPDGRWEAYTHFAYNIGVYNFCKSTLARRVNNGDVTGACDEISRWTYVAGKDCKIKANKCGGIPKRRAYEREWCETAKRPELPL